MLLWHMNHEFRKLGADGFILLGEGGTPAKVSVVTILGALGAVITCFQEQSGNIVGRPYILPCNRTDWKSHRSSK